MRSQIVLTTVAIAFAMSTSALASGGGGFSGGGYSQKKVDQLYELGKSYYKSPQADGTRLKYCVRTDDDLKKLSRRSVKRFKRGPVSEFVDSLYSCADPAVKISDVVSGEQGDAVLYYLNKRYKLRLENG